MNFIKNEITEYATRNDTRKPTDKIIISLLDIAKPCFNIEYADAATIVGIARKKENSAATNLEEPSNIAPIIVAAERDVPGIIAKV